MEELKTVLKTTSRYIALLESNGIHSVKDFLYYFPRSYEDRSKMTKLSELFFENTEQTSVTIQGQVISKKITKRGVKMLREVVIQDQEKNTAHLYFARKAYQVRSVKKDQRYLVIGKPTIKYGQTNMRYPEMIESSEPNDDKKENEEDVIEDFQTGRIYPIYPEMMGIKP